MTKKSSKNSELSKKIVNKNNNKVRKKKSNFDTTTKIRIDKERINDIESLDTSFLEGRMSKKTKNNKKAKEKILTERKQIIKHLNLLKNIMFLIAFITIISIGIIYIVTTTNIFSKDNNNSLEVEDDIVIEDLIDQNYLLIGDFYSENISLDSFKIFNVIKVKKDYTTKDILDNMGELIYKYNPSVVILEIGMNDLNNNTEIEDIKDNIEMIVEGIQNNRSYAKIYIESIYPINEEIKKDELKNVNVEKIKELNKEIRKICDDLDVNYLNIYDLLSFNNVLRTKFSDDGVYLNALGNNEVEKKLKEVVDENEKKKIKKDKD